MLPRPVSVNLQQTEPDGLDSASRPHHISQLASLCERHPVEEKVVFAPTLQIGHNLGTALARSGVAWVNLRVTTPASWAERLVGSALRDEGRLPLVQDADSFFLLGSIRDERWPEDHPLVRGFSAGGFARTLLKTIRALRLAGVRPEDLSMSASGIDGVLARQYAAYSKWLEDARVYDQADLYRRGATEGAGNEIIFAILDETPLPQCAYDFVNACSGEGMLRIGRPSYGFPLPEHSAGVRFSDAPLSSSNGIVGRGGHLQLSGLSQDDRRLIALRRAVGVETEIRGILRELLAAGAVLDEIEIAYTSENPYLSFLVEETDRLNLPTTFGAGVPVTYTRPGQALLGFLRWMASGFVPLELVRFFRSRLIFLGADTDLHEVSAAGGMLLEARLGPGRHGWRNSFERYVDRMDERLGAVESDEGRRYHAFRRDAAGRLMRHLEILYGLCPSEETTCLRAISESALAFLNTFALWEGDRDRRARESLSDRLIDLTESTRVEGRVDELASMLAELIEMHKAEAAVARPGCLYVVPLERAGYSGRAETVILGMAETTFPGPALEDPILLDAARRRFNGKLKLERTRAGDPAFHLVRAMGMASGRVTLTANARDVTDGREIYPAALFEQAKEQLGLKNSPVYSPIPEASAALTDTDVALSLRDSDDIEADLSDEFPWLIQGRNAVEARAAGGIGCYDGWLGQQTPDLRPGATGTFSASRLEDLAACPYRYFLKYVLHVRPPDIPEDVPGRWLTPIEFGSLLHDVLKTFMERLSERGESVDVSLHGPLMDNVVATEIERYKERVPVQFQAGYRADHQRLLRAARVFLVEESRRKAEPVGFEVSFGMGRTGSFDVPDPIKVQLHDGVAVSLRGAIDRVDRTDDGYEIWDYKTGSTYNFDEYDLLSGGRRLQWALYAYVLEDLLRRKGVEGAVRRSGYFFTSDREHGIRLAETPPDRNEVGRRLKPLFDLIGKGAFLHVQKSNVCTFCDYAEICASERKDRKHMDDIVSSALPEQDFVVELRAWMDDER